jgi:diadenosine tetraphosphatase ApaH/serine/threonine PP2A family protein phosphatase
MGRAILVGDVHGCSAELATLLDRIGWVRGSDTLVFVGDLIARGPDSLGVLDLVRETGAIVVRGNHEDRLLAWHHAKLARERGEMAIGPELGRLHHELAHQLREKDWRTLEAPYSYLLEQNRTLVVHAGLVPGVPLDQQDPATMMRIRSVSDRGEARDHGGATPWGARYLGPPHVVFGHAASLEAQVHPWATGIDTGCVYGGYLTAMVLREGEEPPPAACRCDVLVSVPARRRYFEGGVGVGGRAMIGGEWRAPSHGPGPHSARRRSRYPRDPIEAAAPHRRASGRGTRE